MVLRDKGSKNRGIFYRHTENPYICGMMKPQLLIGAAASGSGKTIFTMGLLRALKKRGLQAQPFKCGPDYIDTQFHAVAAGRPSVNLDTWMMHHHHIQRIYNRQSEDADVCVTEGVMGLFDGYSRDKGSAAEIARLLNLPVVLVVNARAAAYSVAPMLFGFKHFARGMKIAGVVFNQVSSASHYAFLKEACTDAGLEALGYLPYAEELFVPSRHLGLTLTARASMNEIVEKASTLVEKYVELDKLLNLCQSVFPCPYTLPYVSETAIEETVRRKLKIAVARDEAFCFIYYENLKRLGEQGRITFFSPLRDNKLPAADLVYLPGGYPELYARRLHHRREIMQQLRAYAEEGGKVYAECGGMMYLGRTLTTRKGSTYEMAGVLPVDFTVEHPRLHLGYREMKYNGVSLRGHEFHFSEVASSGNLSSVARLYDAYGAEVDTPLYRYKNVIAGYTHWYWGETDLMQLWK